MRRRSHTTQPPSIVPLHSRTATITALSPQPPHSTTSLRTNSKQSDKSPQQQIAAVTAQVMEHSHCRDAARIKRHVTGTLHISTCSLSPTHSSRDNYAAHLRCSNQRTAYMSSATAANCTAAHYTRCSKTTSLLGPDSGLYSNGTHACIQELPVALHRSCQ